MEKFIEYTGSTIKIMTCSNCNMKCAHCYIPYSGNFDSKKLLKTIKTLKNKYKILLNGTEPLLNNYLDSFKEAEEKFILTNGLIFKDNIDLVEKIKNAGITRVCMSYHFATQKDLHSVSLSFLDDIFPKVRAKNIDVEAMCTITSLNYNLLETICEKAISLGANYLYFIEYMHDGSAKSNLDEKLKLTNTMREEFFKQLKNVREKYPKDKLYIYRSGNFGNDKINNKKVLCEAGENIVTMTPDKKIYPCNFLISEEFCIGYFDGEKVYIDKAKRDKICNHHTTCLWKNFN